MTTYSEERVLRPLDPVPEDVNDWPDFALREVKIFHQGKGRYADLLEAAPDTPLCVLGELMPLEEQHEHLALLDDPTYKRVKIDHVTNYSFGQSDEGKPVLWAAGKAGWYEIAPSDRYISHYNDTVEAIDLFYFMVDQYRLLPGKRQRFGFMIDPFLKEYQKHTDYRIDDDDEAMEILHKHHKFILKQMIEEREDINWSRTYLWKHLAETYSELIEELQSKTTTETETKMVDIVDEAIAADESNGSAESADLEDSDDQSSSEEEEVRPRTPVDETASSDSEADDAHSHTSDGSTTSTSTSSEEQIDYTKPIWTLLNILRKTSTFDIKNAGIHEVALEVAKLPEMSGGYRAAVSALERHAEPLLRLMNEAKLRKKFNWSTRAIWAELEATLADDVAQQIRTPAPRTSNKKHRLKSVLRPSGAGIGSKRTKSTAVDSDEDAVMRDDPPVNNNSSPTMKRALPNGSKRHRQDGGSSSNEMDSPSRQLNGQLDPDALPELPPAPEAQEMLDLVKVEAKRVGRVNQIHNLEAFLGHYGIEF